MAERPRTLFEKIWDSHVIGSAEADGTRLLYIDRHLIHEGSTPQAFEGLRRTHLVDKMPVDIKKRQTVTALFHDMRVPDFLE